ncbi:MAG TPA: nicotinamide-nucleotide amidohydrolase family protein [Steroidobacteraceae bacterium]|jgi:nicotinamide-nucleotide amidase|nr:nicotinamide-nucleotide amidohydrolase family protein [Steroidobacteraceae bacterium]
MDSPPGIPRVPEDTALHALAVTVGQRLLAARRRAVTVESCTGGYLAKLVTDVADSSHWFECGYVTYSNAAKIRDVGVQSPTLEQHGAVSEATVLEMARGALFRTHADVALSISGVAGPSGGTLRTPVGTVWFAVVWRESEGLRSFAERQHFDGDRDAVRRHSVAHALKMLLAG